MKKSILFVDDEELNLMSLVRTFKDTYKVFSAIDLNKAKDILKLHKIDLILCDIVFPGKKSGIDFLKETEKTYKNIKIVIISGYLDEHQESIKKLKNCVQTIQKPNSPKYYKSVIKEILKGKK